MSSISKGNRATGIVRRAWDAALDFIQRKEVVGMDKNGNKYYRSAISVGLVCVPSVMVSYWMMGPCDHVPIACIHTWRYAEYSTRKHSRNKAFTDR